MVSQPTEVGLVFENLEASSRVAQREAELRAAVPSYRGMYLTVVEDDEPISLGDRNEIWASVDLVDARLDRALAQGVQVIDLREHEDDLPEVGRELT